MRFIANLAAFMAAMMMSAATVNAEQERARAPSPAMETPSCDLAPASADAQIALFGLYEGEAVSTVSVAGMDEATEVVFVDVAPGLQPIYFIATSYSPVIYVFRGARHRIAQAALISSGGEPRAPAVGAIGLPRNAVRVFHASSCFYYFDEVGAPAPRRVGNDIDRLLARDVRDESAPARARVEEILGRAPDLVAARYGAMRINLPSGEIAGAAGQPPPPRGFHAVTWREALRFWPGGLIALDARRVRGARAAPYDVLPAQFGLAQLTGSGALQYLGGGAIEGDYRVVRPIPRYPAGLNGALSVRFLIESGVPVPAGSPGHSCVVIRDTGQASGATCSMGR